MPGAQSAPSSRSSGARPIRQQRRRGHGGLSARRIAAENRRDHASAARWFRTYLSERPSGRLNREAEGRLLESLAFMDRNTAREAARVYLEHHPSGPHAAFARNLLGSSCRRLPRPARPCRHA